MSGYDTAHCVCLCLVCVHETRGPTYFIASSLDICSSVRPLVSGTQRMTNTSRTKLIAAYRNITLGTPMVSGGWTNPNNLLIVIDLIFRILYLSK